MSTCRWFRTSALILTCALAGISLPGATSWGQASPAAPAAPGHAAASPVAATGVTLQIRKELPGDFMYRFVRGTQPISAPAPLPAPAGGNGPIALAAPAGVNARQTQLEILDMNRGNAARLPIVAQGATELTEASFRYVQVVYVPVQSGGKGALGVQVALTNADKTINQSWLLKAADNGVAQFTDVPLGDPVTVTVSYGSNAPKSQTDTLTLNHPADGAHWSPILVDWPDVKTLAAPAASGPVAVASGGAAPHAPTAPPVDVNLPSNPLNALGGMLVNVAFLVAVGYGLYWLYMTGRLKQFLDRAGIQTASPAATPATPGPNPFTAQERAPITPITEGTADPFIGGAGSQSATYHAPTTGPRLIGSAGTYSGTVFPISAGSADIGRDASNAVPLPQDTKVSRKHATIQTGGGSNLVVDHGSSNGTFVNGVRIASNTPHPIQNGDELQIGQTRFRFEG